MRKLKKFADDYVIDLEDRCMPSAELLSSTRNSRGMLMKHFIEFYRTLNYPRAFFPRFSVTADLSIKGRRKILINKKFDKKTLLATHIRSETIIQLLHNKRKKFAKVVTVSFSGSIQAWRIRSAVTFGVTADSRYICQNGKSTDTPGSLCAGLQRTASESDAFITRANRISRGLCYFAASAAPLLPFWSTIREYNAGVERYRMYASFIAT